MKNILLVLSSIVLTIVLTACGQDTSSDSESEDQSANLSVGTTNTSSSLYAYYSGLMSSVEQQAPEIDMTIIETGATLDNITRLENGQIDFGLAVMDGAYEAYEGIGEWEGNEQTDLRSLFTYTENALYYVVSEESGVTTFEGLEGHDFNLGIRGSTTETQTRDILDVLDISVNPHTGDVTDAVNAVKDGNIIGLTKTGVGTSADATVMDLETSLEVRLLGYTDSQIEMIQSEFPWLRTTEIPDDIYDWQTEPITTIAQQIGNVTNSEFSNELAYKLTKAAIEEKELQVDSFQAIEDMDFVDLTLQSPIPLHAGSVEYLLEQDIDVPEELIPPEFEE